VRCNDVATKRQIGNSSGKQVLQPPTFTYSQTIFSSKHTFQTNTQTTNYHGLHQKYLAKMLRVDVWHRCQPWLLGPCSTKVKPRLSGRLGHRLSPLSSTPSPPTSRLSPLASKAQRWKSNKWDDRITMFIVPYTVVSLIVSAYKGLLDFLATFFRGCAISWFCLVRQVLV
jgi:hypothetical protein